MDLFYILLILLATTRAFGELAERVGQPALVGELISGIVLGAVVGQFAESFPNLASLTESAVFKAITDLGMFFIMLFAGIEMQPQKMLKHSGSSFIVALGGMALPLFLGVGLGWLFLPHSELMVAQALFIGTALAITAVPATVRILMDLGKLNSRSGQIIISAAVFDDILSLMLLAWLTGLIGATSTLDATHFALLAVKILLFFAVTSIIGLRGFPWAGHLMKHVREKELDFSLMLIAALAYAVLAEALGLHFILGAFVAGVFFGRKTVDRRTYEAVRAKVSGTTFGFLAPIFFASIGLHLDLAAVTEIPLFLALLIVAAFVGKLGGAGLAAFASGLTKGEAAIVGIGMSARGAVELVIAGIALEAGLFTVGAAESAVVAYLFSAVVLMAIVTTLVTPIILKHLYPRIDESRIKRRSERE